MPGWPNWSRMVLGRPRASQAAKSLEIGVPVGVCRHLILGGGAVHRSDKYTAPSRALANRGAFLAESRFFPQPLQPCHEGRGKIRALTLQANASAPEPLTGRTPPYCGGGCVGGVCCPAGVCPAAGVVAGFFAAGFFFTAGFFAGSVSSTTVFFGGVAGIAACAALKSVRRREISASFAAARF